MNQRTIKANDLERLADQIAKLNKKAVKFGLPKIDWDFGEIREEKVTYTTSGGKKFEHFVDVVDVEFPSLRLTDGWLFLGTIELLDGESTVHTHGGTKLADIPEKFFNAKNTCEHCGHNRSRKHTYILKRGDEFKQVGSTCMRDFLGHTPAAMEFLADIVESAVDGLEEFEERGGEFFGMRVPETDDVVGFITTAIRVIRVAGWLSKTAAGDYRTPTVDTINFVLNPPARRDDAEKKLLQAVTDGAKPEDTNEALAIVEHFAAKNDRENDYEFKLGQLCRSERVETRNRGILASAVESYRRAIARAEEAKSFAKSEWVGEVKERLRGLELIFLRTRSLPDYGFGPSFVHNFKDANGNRFEWKTGTVGEGAFDKDERVVLTGTVKEHREWKGLKSTALSRCVLAS